MPGPAVILGHVDSTAGPAVFFRLRELRPRDIVRVGLADGRILVFRVQRVRRYPKDEFPTEAVYFPTLNRELRLITCGGSFPPFRFAPFPVASTASSTASRGTQDASTPREIQSLKRPPATLPVCVITRDHAGNQPKHPAATRQGKSRST